MNIEKKHPVIGCCAITNLGNTCYMNSALQLIFNSKIMVKLLIRRNVLTMKGEDETPIINKLNKIIKHIYMIGNVNLNPTNLRSLILKKLPEFGNYNQQDCEEFLIKLIDKLIEESTFKFDYRIQDKFEEIHSEYEKFDKKYNDCKTEYDKNLIRKEYNEFIMVNMELYKEYKAHLYLMDTYKKGISKIHMEVFTILMNKNSCSKCHKISLTFEHVPMLQIPLPEGDEYSNGNHRLLDERKYSIEECLENHFKEELLHDYECSSCKNKNTTTRKLTIWKLSPLFLIQIIRSVTIRNTITYKRQNSIIPSESLDMGIYCESFENNINKKYKMNGVVNHMGSHHGGHYYANCKSLVNNSWYTFNDSHISYCNNGFKDIGYRESCIFMYEYDYTD